ncbi:lia operon protein LiaF [Salinibacillus kushneri]|uniref:Lia operon protein LiaF n=1 Tax=Salinibacillus kushneri TaxID=237682 RepID=A0A1I0BB08_9BACI|nr:cell wall-active antibiotics response protein LiaF [Salinibacillus kushneri]SET03638.1 lia operon protein LiaF [Salinibacillus kushneri]
MFQRIPTDTLNWIIVIVIALFLLEILFFNGWLIFSILFSAFMIFVGWRKFSHTWGKIVFLIGGVSLFFNILNTMAVRFLIIAGVILFILHYQRMKKEPEQITPQFEVDEMHQVDNQESLIKMKPLLNNRLFGDQTTSRTSYKWSDISIHSGFGDRIIDLSHTVLPNQAVISIRHLIGNIVIYVPYEVEVQLVHSSIFGRAHILGEHHKKLMNDTLAYKTKNYDTHESRVKIITSIWSGDIEVRRI